MHHRVGVMNRKGSLDLLAIRKFALNEMRPGINGAPVPFTQIIENGNFMPPIQQKLGTNAPDVARAANDKDFHWREKCSVISGKSKATRWVSAAFRASACRVSLV
jgi:hypothetical protein